MEDRYLYKAKTTPKEKGEFNNVWVTGNLIVSNGKYYIHPVGNVVNVKNNIGRIIVMHEVIPDTICRCTGLKDKNGNLIWENDIIKYHFRDLYAQIRYGAYQNCFDSQKAEHIGFYVDWSENRNYRKDLGYWINTVNAEVVGNIFDNQELLESEGIKMSDLIDTLIKMLKDSNAGYVKTKVGEYTIFVTDDDDGAKVLDEAWENYVEESEE